MGLQNQVVRSICGALSLTLLLSACDSSDTIPGIENPSFSVKNNQLYAGFTALNLNIDAGLTMPIPDLKGATIGVNPSLGAGGQAQGTVFQFNVDLTQLTGKNFSVAGLPDGRALPDIDGGVLPRWAFSIKNIDVYLYLADGAFAIFVPIELVSPQGIALPTTISKEIDDERGNMLGKVYAIPAQGAGAVSGLLLLISFINPGISN